MHDLSDRVRESAASGMGCGEAAHPGGLQRALAAWRDQLGAGRVLGDADTLERYGRTTLERAPRASAVLRPREAGQIPDIVRIARAHRVPLYPVSRGRNWGWGDACPGTPGQVVLDLGDLDRIVEIHPQLGYAVVEPGVTQGQLAQALARDAPDWWLESTNAGPDTSILGNTVDRGLGMGDRTASLCGLEAVLPDGQVLRTGFGAFRGSRVTQVAKWGLGPNLEGLFSQSNLGVVTKIGLWLMPRPAGAECCLLCVAEDALVQLLEALRPLRLRGTLPTNVHVFPVQGRDGKARWLAVGAVYGSEPARAAARGDIEVATARFARSLYFEAVPQDIDKALAVLQVQRTSGIEDLFRAGAALCDGQPFAPSPGFVLAYLGGAEVQKRAREPSSADPLDEGYGFYFLWVTCPALGADVSAAIALVTQACAAFGILPKFTIQLPNGRAAVLVVRICFDRTEGDDAQRASRCYQAVLQATVDAGLPPWRLGLHGMSLLEHPTVDMDFARRLKAWMDPEMVLAPGRYLRPLED